MILERIILEGSIAQLQGNRPERELATNRLPRGNRKRP